MPPRTAKRCCCMHKMRPRLLDSAASIRPRTCIDDGARDRTGRTSGCRPASARFRRGRPRSRRVDTSLRVFAVCKPRHSHTEYVPHMPTCVCCVSSDNTHAHPNTRICAFVSHRTIRTRANASSSPRWRYGCNNEMCGLLQRGRTMHEMLARPKCVHICVSDRYRRQAIASKRSPASDREQKRGVGKRV